MGKPWLQTSSKVVRVIRIGSDFSSRRAKEWWATFECWDRKTDYTLNFNAYGSNAHRLVSYMEVGKLYSIQFTTDEHESDGELVSASYIPEN